MRDTQEKRILNLLRTYAPNWCPLMEILALNISQYGRAIHTLRRSGYIIENKLEQHGTARHSFFRLVTKPQAEMFPTYQSHSSLDDYDRDDA